MKRTIITTSDGSTSLKMEQWDETYHSVHGAIQESLHVYIQNGFNRIDKQHIRILEMGFGTGLNAFLSYVNAVEQQKQISYCGIEGFPLNKEEIACLNYANQEEWQVHQPMFKAMHALEWGTEQALDAHFTLKKVASTFEDVVITDRFDLVYFDVFGYPFQPELWSEAIFQKVYDALDSGGVLVTYACRGPIRRAMKAVGFEPEKVPGPPGKREMLVAWKP